ncbi:MAG: hypothetical protein JWM05_3120 [Acidimicrobiales bacterium]|nr:hypothetical protein [Acidimicrobiales bacterium]
MQGALLIAMLGTNVAGAVAVFAFAAWALPNTQLAHTPRVVLLNAVLAAAYLAVAVPVGIVWGAAWLRTTVRWLREERDPTPAEARDALRGPRRLLVVQAVLWLVAAVGFTIVDGLIDSTLIARVAPTITLGGVSICAMTYLIAERLTRPVVTKALAAGHGWPRLPGVTTRAMLAWALGSGVPFVGLIVTGIAAIVDRANATQVSVAVITLAATGLLFGFTMSLLDARAVADPVRSVREALARVQGGDLDVHIDVYDGSELGRLQAGVNHMAAGLREREELRDLFGRHVGQDVAAAALARGPELGGETREVAVLFVDLVGSTSLATDRPAAEVVEMLNRFFAVVIDVVGEHGGWINKFEGDAALAVFGAPESVDDPAGRALAAGRELTARLPHEVPDVDAGIGVAAGPVVAGNVGDAHRFEYTVIGDPVNVASRLTDLAKVEPCRLLASCDAVDAAARSEARQWEPAEEVLLRGRPTPLRLARPRHPPTTPVHHWPSNRQSRGSGRAS